MPFDADAVAAAESLRLTSFTSLTAHTLGDLIRTHIRANFPDQPAVVQITAGSSEQLLYFSVCADGTQLDNRYWVERKRRAVVRWGKSTAGLRCKWTDGLVPSYYSAGEDEYAIHGGGFPLRVQGVEPLVAVVIVSGLSQEDDHQCIADVLAKFIKDQEPLAK
ncbi:hypothetical protein JCM1840_001770 [Sporobolomyces johnsonii]